MTGEAEGIVRDLERVCGVYVPDAAPLPAMCPGCGGEMQPYDDGEYTSRCEDCGWVRP